MSVMYMCRDVNDFNYFFFSKRKKENNEKALISIKMLLFFDTIMDSCTNVPATMVSSYAYDNEDCQDHQFLLLKH